MTFRVNNNRGPNRNASRNSNAKLNTHYYDGKLLANELVQAVHDQQKVADAELTTHKHLLFTGLIEDIKINPAVLDKYRPTAIRAIEVIKQNIRQKNNYDQTNSMYADDVLYMVCKKIDHTKNKDVLVYLSEQLSDILTSGQCSQGRSTRIFQVLSTLDKGVAP